MERFPRRGAVALMGTAAAIVAVALLWGADKSEATSASAASVTVVIGDLAGPDSVLGLAVREALRAELVNTNGVLLTSDVGMRELRTLMRLPRDSALSRPDLIALSARSGATIAIVGSVIPVASGAQIVLELVDPASGRSLRTFAERPGDGNAILAAVERLGRAIGSAVTVAPRDSTVRALPSVTTASLAALKSYATARQIAATGKRQEALAPGERAVVHDSTFVLAHYFLGDLLWFLDEQSHSEAHLTKAYELRGTVPAREQLVIRARYEQLVRDRPDSALAYWDLLHDMAPGDVLAYEGRTWALRALGRHEEAAAAADTAMRLDETAVAPNTNNAMYSWLAVGDTTSALLLAERVAARNPEAVVEARFYAALFREDLPAALAWADSGTVLMSRQFRRQLAHLASGNLASAAAAMDTMRANDRAQFVPRALINQGWTESALGGDLAARVYAREALAWLGKRDLSPPAVARLAERIGDLAARAGDEQTVRATVDLVRQRDRGRALPSYVLAQRTLDASLAFVRGDHARAADLAATARHGVYFWRSLVTILQLEADARRRAGQRTEADSLERLVATRQIVDGDFETWALLRAATALRPPGTPRVAAR
jgi:tetratricopeptide (TPR) repeat protein